MAEAPTTTSARSNGNEPSVPIDPPAGEHSDSLLTRAWSELAGVVARRHPRADIDQREPTPARGPRRARPRLHPRATPPVLAVLEPVVPGRGARARQRPRRGAGAAGWQPLGRE